MASTSLQERLRASAGWYRGVNRAVNQPRPARDLETAKLLEEAANALDIRDAALESTDVTRRKLIERVDRAIDAMRGR